LLSVQALELVDDKLPLRLHDSCPHRVDDEVGYGARDAAAQEVRKVKADVEEVYVHVKLARSQVVGLVRREANYFRFVILSRVLLGCRARA
jgi:hypothetical protein